MYVSDDLLDAPDEVYRDKELALYVIGIGLSILRTRKRRKRRLEIKAKGPSPETPRPTKGDPHPYSRFSEIGKLRMSQLTNEWLGESGWYIRGKDLLDCTKLEVQAEIERERSSGDGHYANAAWYEALIEPMKRDDQTVGDFWRKYKGKRPPPPVTETRPTA